MTKEFVHSVTGYRLTEKATQVAQSYTEDSAVKMFRPNELRSRKHWLNLTLAIVVGTVVFGLTTKLATASGVSPDPGAMHSNSESTQDQDEAPDEKSKERIVKGPWRSPRTATGRAPIEDLVPPNTKALVVIRDFDLLGERLEATQFGKIFAQEELKPVVDEVRRKLEKNLTDANQQLGFSIEDIRGVRTGEVGFASLLPAPEGHAVAAIADVKGNEDAARDLLARVSKNLVDDRKAKELEQLAEGNARISQFKLPIEKGEAFADLVFFTLSAGFVLASDNEETIRSLVRSVNDNQPPEFVPLAGLKTFRGIRERVRTNTDGTDDSDIRWYVEPFGLSDAVRNSIQPGERSKHYANYLKRQGFSAIKGMGGTLVFSRDSFDVLHRTFIYAPNQSESQAEGGERFELAARALALSNVPASRLAPPKWIPPSTATYFATHWDILRAFDSIGTLVDDIVGSEGSFDRMLQGLKNDPMGPRVDLREEVFTNLESQVVLYSDIVRPIELNSERMMVAIPIKNSDTVREAIAKIMAVEPGIVVHEIAGQTVYEKDLAKLEQENSDPGIPDVDIFNDPLAEPKEEIETEESLAGWNTYTVTDEHLLVGNNLEFVKSILTEEVSAKSLAESDDYKQIAKALDALAGEEASIIQFGRQDEVLRVTFELLRQGKMPESQSLLGEFLNRQLGTGEPGVLREQQIDPESLPQEENAYDQLVAPYIGPSGWRCITDSNGWLVIGGMLPKEQAVKTETRDSDDESANETTSNSSDGNSAGNNPIRGN